MMNNTHLFLYKQVRLSAHKVAAVAQIRQVTKQGHPHRSLAARHPRSPCLWSVEERATSTSEWVSQWVPGARLPLGSGTWTFIVNQKPLWEIISKSFSLNSLLGKVLHISLLPSTHPSFLFGFLFIPECICFELPDYISVQKVDSAFF